MTVFIAAYVIDDRNGDIVQSELVFRKQKNADDLAGIFFELMIRVWPTERVSI